MQRSYSERVYDHDSQELLERTLAHAAKRLEAAASSLRERGAELKEYDLHNAVAVLDAIDEATEWHDQASELDAAEEQLLTELRTRGYAA